MTYEFKFPDVGEGITEGEIVSWKVKEGDTVRQDQTLAEVETDKAVVELPSPVAGVVKQLHGAAGDMVNVGDVLVTLEPGGTSAQPAAQATAQPETQPAPPPYTGSVVGRLEEAPEEEAVPPAEHPAVRPGPRPQTPDAHQAPAPPTAEQREILALPSVRALAKELGVDLALVRGTGPGGRIVMQDVEDIAQEAAYSGHTPPTASAPALPPGADADAYGPIERFPFRGVRRTMAKRMAESASKQAQVTTMDQADVTVLRHIREKEKEVAAGRGIRLTYLAFAVKACTSALKRFPRLNATLDPTGDEYTLKHYCNVGIAVDTEHGLMVPNIKNAGDKSIYDIASELVDLVHKAQERTLDVADLHGGTFTITNYGAIGSTYATPIVNYPEVAILGMGRVGEVPVVRNGQIVARLVLPLSLTFDHQLVDGAEAARFLNAVVGYLEDPDLLLLEGA